MYPKISGTKQAASTLNDLFCKKYQDQSRWLGGKMILMETMFFSGTSLLIEIKRNYPPNKTPKFHPKWRQA
jgi:hypothetical protein